MEENTLIEETFIPEIPDVSVSLSIPDLILAVADSASLAKDDVEKIIYTFIEYHLKKFKLS